MPRSDHQEAWIATKQITPAIEQRIAKIKQELDAKLLVEIAALKAAESQMLTSGDFQDFYRGVDELAQSTRRLSYLSHEIKCFCDWGVDPVPEFNDHSLNVHFLMQRHKRTFWLEGAIFCGLGIEPGKRILELCCGSGFYTDLFYAPFASEIVAVDFDPRAIEMARNFHQAGNVRYEVQDIRENLPEGPFDAVIWDTAIEHFTVQEIDAIMLNLRQRMVPGAPLLGYTVAESPDEPQHPDHETHFDGMASLATILKRSFRNVRVFERIHPTLQPARHNLFFYASDGPLPFDPEWAHGIRL